jgi:hypothetical protein
LPHTLVKRLLVCFNQRIHNIFIFLLQALDSQQNMMKDNAAKACLRQITLPQEKNAKYCMQ